jgi:tetratricopeptide repeat protein 19
MKAEKLYVDVMQRQLSYKGVPKDDNSIIAMSLKLAAIFSKTKQYEKAQQGFEFCINTTESKIKAGNAK